jgi:putative ABC transport system permease protein
MKTSVAWQNIVQNPKRTLAAVAGISFSILLVFMQLGFLQGARKAAATLFECFSFDLAVVSERYKYMGAPDMFDSMRLKQALSLPGVASADNLNIARGEWKDPDTELISELLIFGFPENLEFIQQQRIRSGMPSLDSKNAVMADLYSHADFGDLSIGREAEINHKKVTIGEQFTMGVTLFADGCVIVNGDTFFRLVPRNRRLINAGFLKLQSGTDPLLIKKRLHSMLPDDVVVYTREEIIEQEQDYFVKVKPVGIIFQTGVLVAFVVGVVILFQVLNTDITSRLDEYATLKAMGFGSRFIYGVGIQQALIYALAGYFPALVISAGVYRVVHLLSRMPMDITLSLATLVLMLSLSMCALSSILGLQKVRRTDPAELF